MAAFNALASFSTNCRRTDFSKWKSFEVNFASAQARNTKDERVGVSRMSPTLAGVNVLLPIPNSPSHRRLKTTLTVV